MRQHFVDSKNKQRTQKKSECGGNHFGETFSLTHFNGWSQQAPKTGCNHNSTRETEHSVQNSSVHGFKQKNKRGSQSSQKPSE